MASALRLGSGARFKKLSSALAQGGAKNPDALAASIGGEKFGKKKFQALAAAGQRAVSK